ncbi:10724_t:CDS:2 [Cetraspora pellucida]|uniref:10724_t:CDS:1 n=1 Tax=Cetraspora pellucida TaxID=1433469 RepID=A0A9N9E303_9GLOM|nr:10724_t:CDS:2 [Cetraspora pellucida]
MKKAEKTSNEASDTSYNIARCSKKDVKQTNKKGTEEKTK